MRQTIKYILPAGLTGVLVAATSWAQTSSPPERHTQGYVFVAPGRVSRLATLHFGGGGELVRSNGFGVGAEIGYLTESCPDPGGRGCGKSDGGSKQTGNGLFSFDGSYHINAGDSGKLVPFGTGGFSLIINPYGDNEAGFNFGGGVNYWLRNGMGLRLEFRDHVFYSHHHYGFRIGLAFGH
ncbi:MAG: hypothetical protein HY646_04730 [Acidobacteria bacterium]|nr:hypothetical protein [Acidobacteriota bacterium]